LAWFIHTKRLSPWVAGLSVEITQVFCYVILITVRNPVVKYVFVMIATAASQSFFAIIWPERIRAARGTTTAGLAIGITNAGGQLMGIVGPQVYQSKFGPTYHISYICSIALLAACIGAVVTSWFLCKRML
jgi:nitrate/nitrite transporter NarK